MEVLAWLAFPMIATTLAMGWAAWRGRAPRRSAGRIRGKNGGFAAVDDFRRFTDAVIAPGPRATPARRTGWFRS